jgi:hypothetical protein
MQCLIEARSIWFQSISALGVKTVFKLSVSYVFLRAEADLGFYEFPVHSFIHKAIFL